MAMLNDLDETLPTFSMTPTDGDNHIRQIKDKLKVWADMEHDKATGRHKIHRGPAQPEGAFTTGQLWINTSGAADELYEYTGSAWVKLTSGSEITALQSADTTLQAAIDALDVRLDTAEVDIVNIESDIVGIQAQLALPSPLLKNYDDFFYFVGNSNNEGNWAGGLKAGTYYYNNLVISADTGIDDTYASEQTFEGEQGDPLVPIYGTTTFGYLIIKCKTSFTLNAGIRIDGVGKGAKGGSWGGPVFTGRPGSIGASGGSGGKGKTGYGDPGNAGGPCYLFNHNRPDVTSNTIAGGAPTGGNGGPGTNFSEAIINNFIREPFLVNSFTYETIPLSSWLRGGSGGGAGGISDDVGGSGGNGGPAIIIIAPTITINGIVDLRGNDGGGNFGGQEGGGGGGGGGGGILLVGQTINLTGAEFRLTGGAGGLSPMGDRNGGAGGTGFYGTILL